MSYIYIYIYWHVYIYIHIYLSTICIPNLFWNTLAPAEVRWRRSREIALHFQWKPASWNKPSMWKSRATNRKPDSGDLYTSVYSIETSRKWRAWFAQQLIACSEPTLKFSLSSPSVSPAFPGRLPQRCTDWNVEWIHETISSQTSTRPVTTCHKP